MARLLCRVPRYALTVAYDGTDFCGWQKQEPPAAREGVVAPFALHVMEATATDTVSQGRVALRTVQAVVERAVREVVREPVILAGASRTDSGVHALGQVAAFTCSGDDAEVQEGGMRGAGWPLARGCEVLVRAINSRLPADVVVLRARVAAAGFDPVRWAVRKQYVYSLRQSPHRALFDRTRVYCVHDPLDVPAMRRAAARVVGTHDFAGLSAMHHGRLTTVRTVETCEIEEGSRELRGRLPDVNEGAGLVQIRVSGTGFLYNMVRIIAGTLLDVGRGRLGEDVFDRVFATNDRRLAGPTLAPQGLCLEWIEHSEQGENCVLGELPSGE
jgi:tRNA pseudouridine38-40 synthase